MTTDFELAYMFRTATRMVHFLHSMSEDGQRLILSHAHLGETLPKSCTRGLHSTK